MLTKIKVSKKLNNLMYQTVYYLIKGNEDVFIIIFIVLLVNKRLFIKEPYIFLTFKHFIITFIKLVDILTSTLERQQ